MAGPETLEEQMPVNSTAAELVAPVIALEDRGRIPRALRLVDSLMATHGRSAELLAARARLLGAQGRLVDAQETADLAADLWPDSAAAHQARGDVLASAELNVAALAAADRALALGGPAVGALVVRSSALKGLGRAAEAVSTARFAVQLEPNDPAAVSALCLALAKLDREAALAEAELLLSRRGRDAWGYVVRCLLRSELDDMEGAAADGAEAVRLDPENCNAVLCGLLAAFQQGRFDDTIARAGDPLLRDDVTAWFVIGMAHQLSGRPEAAVAKLEAVVRQQPRNVKALEMLLNAQLELRDWDAVAMTAARILAFSPDDFDALMARARAWCETDRAAAAIRDLDRILERQPNEVHALAIRALAHLLCSQHQQALRDADAAVRAGDSTDSVAYTARMLALLALHRRAEAEATARQILQHHPEHSIARQIQEAKDARWKENLDSILTLARAALGLGFL
jgi:tetratricopeptide (TPR) repeat protein